MSLHLALDLAPESASRARRAVRGYVEGAWPESRTDAVLRDLADDVELVASELVANAVRHGATPVSLLVMAGEEQGTRSVTMHACDGGSWDASDAEENGGRGLLIVSALSTSVRVEHARPGTQVVVRLERPWPSAPLPG
jgi:anti-sigma regulatory factor (Ser/Thr protein kinase)